MIYNKRNIEWRSGVLQMLLQRRTINEYPYFAYYSGVVAHVAVPIRSNIVKLCFERIINKRVIWMYPFVVECEACVRKCIWDNGIRRLNVVKLNYIAEWNSCSSKKGILILHKYLRQNSHAGLHFITDGIVNIEVWVEGEPYVAVCYTLLWTIKKGWQTSLLLTTLRTEKLHLLHGIGMQNTSVVRRGYMSVIMIWIDIVVTVEIYV